MRELMQELMSDYARELVFVHILSAILWVGGMLVLRIAVSPSLKNIKDETVQIARSLEIMKKFFNIALASSVLLLITAVIFIVGLSLKSIGGDIYQMAMIKEAIWVIMFGILLFIYFKRNKAQRYFVSGDLQKAKNIVLLVNKFILVNIIFGLISIYIGVILRGF